MVTFSRSTDGKLYEWYNQDRAKRGFPQGGQAKLGLSTNKDNIPGPSDSIWALQMCILGKRILRTQQLPEEFFDRLHKLRSIPGATFT